MLENGFRNRQKLWTRIDVEREEKKDSECQSERNKGRKIVSVCVGVRVRERTL